MTLFSPNHLKHNYTIQMNAADISGEACHEYEMKRFDRTSRALRVKSFFPSDDGQLLYMTLILHLSKCLPGTMMHCREEQV